MEMPAAAFQHTTAATGFLVLAVAKEITFATFLKSRQPLHDTQNKAPIYSLSLLGMEVKKKSMQMTNVNNKQRSCLILPAIAGFIMLPNFFFYDNKEF